MNMFYIVEYTIFIIILTTISINLGNYIYKVKNSQEVFLTRYLSPIENFIYKVSEVERNKEMKWKEYAFCVIQLTSLGIIFVFFIQIFQNILPLNIEKFQSVKWDLALNTAISFATNTNWQSYNGEDTLSYFVQMVGLTSQNFISPAIGLAVFFAFIRGFIRKKEETLGNFWVDLVRIILYILIPVSIIISICLLSQGVIQNLSSYIEVDYLIKTRIPMGPVASQVAIKQLGTNGGGFFGVNSTHPFENPTSISNFIELISILLIPAATCFTFGRLVNNKKAGWTLYLVMLTIFTVGFFLILNCEISNLEGKELRNGIFSSSLWAAATTATSNGSVNSMHSSFGSLSVLVMLFFMQIGEVIFGGIGTGIIGMIIYSLVTVFISGLMIGRTPEYLKNKIEEFEIKMICCILLIPPICILIALSIIVSQPDVNSWISLKGANSFTEVYYNMISAGNNNGSSFQGYISNNLFNNLMISFLILVGRFVPIICALALSGNIVKKNHIPISSGTLMTDTFVFALVLIGVIIIVGALIFFPALALGPIAGMLRVI